VKLLISVAKAGFLFSMNQQNFELKVKMMSVISAKDVSELRRITNAGMMDCKEALRESNGDFDKAIEILRKKGQAVAAKRADRDAKEGVVIAKTNAAGTQGVILAISCETDFVAKNELFIAFANQVADLALAKLPKTREELLALSLDGASLSEKLVEQTGKTGEKVELSSYQLVSGKKLASYIHAGSKIGVLVSFDDAGQPNADDFFRKIAMHIAAMNPVCMTPDEFDLEFVQKEAEALRGAIVVENEDRTRLGKPLKTVPQFASRRQLTPEVMARVEEDIKNELRAEGKPEKIWDKIIPGKIDRFISDNTQLDQERCLLSQVFVMDDSKTVEKAISDFGAKLIEFKRVAVG
jgi:elongation factor Ts